MTREQLAEARMIELVDARPDPDRPWFTNDRGASYRHFLDEGGGEYLVLLCAHAPTMRVFQQIASERT